MSRFFKIRLYIKPLALAVYSVVCKCAQIFNQDVLV